MSKQLSAVELMMLRWSFGGILNADAVNQAVRSNIAKVSNDGDIDLTECGYRIFVSMILQIREAK